MRNQILICSILSMLVLSACSVQVRNNDEKPEAKALHLATTEQLQQSVKATERANEYNLTLAWPANADNSVRICRDSEVIAILSGSQNTVTLPVAGGAKLTYVVDHINADGSLGPSTQMNIQVPHDLVWNDTFMLTDSLNIEGGRLFLTDKARIIVLNKNLTINVDEIHSDRGLIETFPADSIAARDTKGLDGGTIKINAKKADGNLQVILRGQQGGAGLQRPLVFSVDKAPQQPCYGTSGGAGGASGNIYIKVIDGKLGVNARSEEHTYELQSH